MKMFNSNQLITELQQQTENFVSKVTEWQMLPPRQLLHKENTDKWSAAQCLAHLNSYGDYYLPALRTSIHAALQKGWLHTDNFRSSWLGNYFTELMLPKGEAKTVKKMKAPKSHTPQSNLDSDAVIATFIEQQEVLIQLLQKAVTVDIAKAKVPVSISKLIKLSAGDTFRFLIAHNYRHLVQAERALQLYKTLTATAIA